MNNGFVGLKVADVFQWINANLQVDNKEKQKIIDDIKVAAKKDKDDGLLSKKEWYDYYITINKYDYTDPLWTFVKDLNFKVDELYRKEINFINNGTEQFDFFRRAEVTSVEEIGSSNFIDLQITSIYKGRTYTLYFRGSPSSTPKYLSASFGMIDEDKKSPASLLLNNEELHKINNINIVNNIKAFGEFLEKIAACQNKKGNVDEDLKMLKTSFGLTQS